MKILRNTTLADIELLEIGLTIPASGQVEVNTESFLDLAADNSITELTPLINSGDIIVNDGTVDLSAADGLTYIAYPDDAASSLYDNTSSGLAANTVQKAIDEIASSSTDNNFAYFPIWAEENAGLGNNQREWSFGNGATGDIGIVLPIDAQLVAVSYNADAAGTNTEIAVVQNSSSQVATTGPQSGEDGFVDLDNPVQFSAGDRVGFQTITAGGASDVRVTAWFRVPTNILLDESAIDHGNLNAASLLDDDHPQYLTEARHDALPFDNPHNVNQAQVGLGNVDNTSDLDKPISTATQAALDLKYDASNPNGYETPVELDARDTANRDRANHTGTQPASTITGLSSVATSGNHGDLTLDDGTNPHGTTQTDVGLGNVDNTSDLDKPISTATQAALDLKYDASNPNGYETPAELNARDTANRDRANHTGTQPASTITGLSAVATSGNHSDLTLDDGTNPHGTTKADVGLGNVDNTSDLDKPISTATQAALDLKADNSIEINSVSGETTGGGDLTANRTIGLANVGTAGSSSAADSTLDLTVDAKGRTTSFSRTLIDIVSSQVSNFAATVRSTVLTGLSITDAVVTAADTVLSAIGKLQGQINGILANFLYAETTLNDAGLVKNTQVFEVYETLNANVPVTGDYKILWTYVWSLNDASNDFVGQVRVNGTVIYDHIQEPKDAGGTGVTLPNTDGGNTNTGTNQRHVLTAHEVINLTAGANTIDIQFRCSTNNDRAAIYRARISIEKFGVS